MARKKLAPTQQEPPKRAFGYVRVSTEEQADEGISLAMQRKRLAAYCELHSLELVEVFSDEGFSGKSLERPGLKALLERVAGDEAEAVVVYKLDRLTRSVRDLLELVEDRFHKGNTRFLSITEHIDTESAMGKFFLTIMGALAEMERSMIAERTRAALAHKKDQGEHVGSPPLGYRMAEGALVEAAGELAVVAQIKAMKRRGKSLRKIAIRLNEEGVRTKRGGAWYASTVRAILSHERHRRTGKHREISGTPQSAPASSP